MKYLQLIAPYIVATWMEQHRQYKRVQVADETAVNKPVMKEWKHVTTGKFEGTVDAKSIEPSVNLGLL